MRVMANDETEGYQGPPRMRPSTCVLVVAGIAAALVAHHPVLPALRRIDVARIVWERAS